MDTKTLIEDLSRMRGLVDKAWLSTGTLVTLAAKPAEPEKVQQELEKALAEFEAASLELRKLCERHCFISGSYRKKRAPPVPDASGYAETVGYDWLHICVRTLLPSSRYRTAEWFSDTIRRILDGYEQTGKRLPFYRQALLVIEERSEISGRRVFDQDNKGWKAVSNAIKGRLIPDDDQYTLGVALLSTWSSENACHITLLDVSDAGDFFSRRRRGGDL